MIAYFREPHLHTKAPLAPDIYHAGTFAPLPLHQDAGLFPTRDSRAGHTPLLASLAEEVHRAKLCLFSLRHQRDGVSNAATHAHVYAGCMVERTALRTVPAASSPAPFCSKPISRDVSSAFAFVYAARGV